MKTLSKLITGIGLIGLLGCGDGRSPIISRSEETVLSLSRERFDVVDITRKDLPSEELEFSLEAIRHLHPGYPYIEGFSTLEFEQDTLVYNGDTYLLGFFVSGEVRSEDSRTNLMDRIQQDLDFAADTSSVSREPEYLRLSEVELFNEDSYIIDGPNVPETEEFTARLGSFNSARSSIRFNPIHLYTRNGKYTDENGNVVEVKGWNYTAYDENGRRIVDAIEVIPIAKPGAGSTGDGFDALYVMTGDEKWLDPQVRYPNMPKIDSVKVYLPESDN